MKADRFPQVKLAVSVAIAVCVLATVVSFVGWMVAGAIDPDYTSKGSATLLKIHVWTTRWVAIPTIGVFTLWYLLWLLRKTVYHFLKRSNGPDNQLSGFHFMWLLGFVIPFMVLYLNVDDVRWYEKARCDLDLDALLASIPELLDRDTPYVREFESFRPRWAVNRQSCRFQMIPQQHVGKPTHANTLVAIRRADNQDHR